ncbi:MAG: hypothetical protein ACXWWD_01070 [Chitinophagaceae bacterium]
MLLMLLINMPGIKNKIEDAVERLNLNLAGKVVLTEAATGAYIVTPVIAALAGAEVYAYTRDTKYGTVADVKRLTDDLLNQFGDRKLKVTVIDELTPDIIAKADIITNSGHLRPLDREKLQYTKKGTVIPLMYEAWEWRDADLDLEHCKKNGIVVGATNERHPDVDVFNYLGDMAVKQIFDAGLCPYKNRFVLICNNDFGPFIAKVIARNCEGLGVIDTEENKDKYNLDNIDWIGNFPDINIPEKYKDAEAVIFTAYPFDQDWIGENSPVSIQKIKDEFHDPLILRYAGDIETKAFDRNKVRYFPAHVHSGHMGILPSAIGNDPIIRLQSGGLKVGELLTRNESKHKEISLVDYI